MLSEGRGAGGFWATRPPAPPSPGTPNRGGGGGRRRDCARGGSLPPVVPPVCRGEGAPALTRGLQDGMGVFSCAVGPSWGLLLQRGGVFEGPLPWRGSQGKA